MTSNLNLETQREISPRMSLISAFILHTFVEIPFFIFPVVLLLVGDDVLQSLGSLSWIGLGAIGTIGTLAAAFPSPIFGAIADKYRRGSLMMLSVAVAGIGAAIIGLWGDKFVTLLIGELLLGIALSIYHPPGLSWVSSAYERGNNIPFSNKLNKILAIHGIGGTLGASIGPISVYILITDMNWREIYLLWAFPVIFVSIIFWIFFGRFEKRNNYSKMNEEKMKSVEVNLGYNPVKIILPIIFLFVISMSIGRGMVNFVLSPFLSEVKGMQIATAALFIGFSTLIGSTGQMAGGYFGDKYGEVGILGIAAFSQIFVLFGIFILENPAIIFFLYVFLGIVNALFWPSTNSLVAKYSAQRGRAFGMVMLIANIFGALGPTIDGILLAICSGQYNFIFIIAGLMSAFALFFLAYLKLFDRKRSISVEY
ncbi:MAG: MFS transporter [Candidatus Heimdallarchaeota archaeon]|nr:MFS transporter [Candidatus Heimdallarchaeota archaeon]